MSPSAIGRAEPDPPFLESAADPDPLAEFSVWFDDATTVVRMPEAMALCTVGPDGRPSARMVLCKGWDAQGFVFYTNHQSRKGTELDARPVAALLFYWEPLGRQVRIEGDVQRVSDEQADRYFTTRPRAAQIGAWASAQSATVDDRATLERSVAGVEVEFEGREVIRPPWWGGYRLRPGSFEFWQNRQNRLHDRLRYVPESEGEGAGAVGAGGAGIRWRIERLQP